jgi:lauroyl/myristoyl acyltransferase
MTRVFLVMMWFLHWLRLPALAVLGRWWHSSPERIRRLVRLDGGEKLVAYKDRPVILLVPHFVGIDAGWIRLALEHGLVAAERPHLRSGD